MTVSLLVALGSVLLAAAVALVLVLRRRNPGRSPKSEPSQHRSSDIDRTSQASQGPHLSLADPAEDTAATAEPDKSERGQALSPPRSGISFHALRHASAGAERPRMDPRELRAADQQTRVARATEQPWRQTSRASVRVSSYGDDVLVLERPILQGSKESAFARLVSRGSDVILRLGPAVDRIDVAWPKEALLAYDGGVRGYFMPPLEQYYVVDFPGHGQAVRTLGAANGIVDVEHKRLDDADLLQLVETVAVWLRAMHAAGVVFGDLGLRSIAYDTAPLRIRVLDYDTARVAGRAALLGSDRGGDHDPFALAGQSSYDSDRFLFAELAFRLLVTRTNHGKIDSHAVPNHLLGLDESRTSRLKALWERAAGPRGTRPTMDEWADALAAY